MAERLLFTLVFLLLLAAAIALLRRLAGRNDFSALVHEWEHGLLYVDGRFEGVLPAGRYWTLPFGPRREIHRVVKRQQYITTAPVDAMSADRLPVRLSAHVIFRVSDPRTAFEALISVRSVIAATVKSVVAIAAPADAAVTDVEKIIARFAEEFAVAVERVVIRSAAKQAGTDYRIRTNPAVERAGAKDVIPASSSLDGVAADADVRDVVVAVTAVDRIAVLAAGDGVVTVVAEDEIRT